MRRKIRVVYLSDARARGKTKRRGYGLQVFLWALWTIAVATTAYFSWHHDLSTLHQLNTLALVIHCTLAGLLGLIVITKIEMRLQPWKFLE